MKIQLSNLIEILVDQILTGRPQRSGNLEIIPIFSTVKPHTKYLTLKEGLDSGNLEILEKNIHGSVPELKVINRSNKRILLLVGEELSGAKQNRILNTSILLKKQSETIIPVSCTESGRWNYSSPKFEDSDIVATFQIRKKTTASVSKKLFTLGNFRTDQQEIWNEVEREIHDQGVSISPTRAMKDVYIFNEHFMKTYMEEIKPLKGQQGFIARINGRIKGMEYLSSPRAFWKLCHKLIKSYTLEAKRRRRDTPHTGNAIEDTPEAFLNRLKTVSVSQFKSPGHGYDLRLSGNKITGTALKYKKEIIHLAVFSDTEKTGKNYETLPDEIDF